MVGPAVTYAILYSRDRRVIGRFDRHSADARCVIRWWIGRSSLPSLVFRITKLLRLSELSTLLRNNSRGARHRWYFFSRCNYEFDWSNWARHLKIAYAWNYETHDKLFFLFQVYECDEDFARSWLCLCSLERSLQQPGIQSLVIGFSFFLHQKLSQLLLMYSLISGLKSTFLFSFNICIGTTSYG